MFPGIVASENSYFITRDILVAVFIGRKARVKEKSPVAAADLLLQFRGLVGKNNSGQESILFALKYIFLPFYPLQRVIYYTLTKPHLPIIEEWPADYLLYWCPFRVNCL